MQTTPPRRSTLWLLALACLIPLPFCVGALLVNVEIALRVFRPHLHFFDRLLPQGLYHIWAVLSADLSTVSTLIPVLILAFPLGQILRILRRQAADPTLAQRLGPDPYPSHFGFFQVMLGLTGTLYGMYIGLDVSGVSELAGQAPTAESIRQSLDRLLGGTATALLSSLVGLIGAFITARPVPWLFGRVTGVQADASRQTLTATIERLTEDLRGLSQASRTFADYLNPETAQTLLQRLERQELATREACSRLDQTNATLATMAQAQSVATGHLARLEAVEQALRDLLPLFEASGRQLAELAQAQQQANDLLGQAASRQDAAQQQQLQTLAGLVRVATAQREQGQRDQQALRTALAAYLQPAPPSP